MGAFRSKGFDLLGSSKSDYTVAFVERIMKVLERGVSLRPRLESKNMVLSLIMGLFVV